MDFRRKSKRIEGNILTEDIKQSESLLVPTAQIENIQLYLTRDSYHSAAAFYLFFPMNMIYTIKKMKNIIKNKLHSVTLMINVQQGIKNNEQWRKK